MSGAELWEPVKAIGAALAVIMIGVSGFLTGRKKGPAVIEHAEVVAATFTERTLMERLIAALDNTRDAVRDSTEQTAELTGLLKADAHRREVETEVRKQLLERGITP